MQLEGTRGFCCDAKPKTSNVYMPTWLSCGLWLYTYDTIQLSFTTFMESCLYNCIVQGIVAVDLWSCDVGWSNTEILLSDLSVALLYSQLNA